MKKKVIVLIASLAAGVIAAILTRVYIAGKEAEVQGEISRLRARYGTIDVLCFKRDIAGGTEISRADLGVLSVPELGLRGQALTEENVADIVGRKVLLGHSKGDIIMWGDIDGGNPTAKGLSSDVKRMMRAISINCSGAASVSGMVKPNDRVDVIATFTFPGTDGKARIGDLVTSTILQNVLVLATGRKMAKTRGELADEASGYTTVTLEVTPREAEMLAFAEQVKGRLVLTLRNANDSSYEKELPKIDFEKIRAEIEELNLKRQQKNGGR